MRILRIRRGFTTNSSSFTEWLPPPEEESAGQGEAVPPAAGAGNPNPGTPATGQGAAGSQNSIALIPKTGGANQQSTGLSSPPAKSTAAPQSPGHLAGNTLTIGGILATLAAVFVIERIIRRFRRTDKAKLDDE